MAKKDKSVDKIVKKVNKEFEKTSTQVETLIGEALKQFDSLQSQIQEPIRKLIGDLDQMREREMKRFNEELDRRLNELHDLQDSVLERLGVASGKSRKAAKKAETKSADVTKKAETKARKKAPATTRKATAATSTAKSAAKSTAESAASAAGTEARPAAKARTTAKKPSAAGPAATAAIKPKVKKSQAHSTNLKKILGIGPATEKKLKNAGITSIGQIANPSPAEQDILREFSSVKGAENWSNEAKKLV